MKIKVNEGKEGYKEQQGEEEEKNIPGTGEASENIAAQCEAAPASNEDELCCARIAELEMERDRHREQAEKFRDELLRKAADFENFRKQKEREAMLASSRALENIVRELLPLIDDVKRVLTHAQMNSETSSYARPYIEGVELLKKNLDRWLEQKGVTAIESKGLKLDVNFHEAISQIDHPEAESDTIIDEYQTGYLLGDKVIRHAKVIVAR